MKPLLKWPGGKRRVSLDLASRLVPEIGSGGRYLELFAGGAAVFFEMERERSVLVDVCKPLMSFYEAVQREPLAVFEEVELLKDHPLGEWSYNQIRSEWNGDDFGVRFAARMMYLNRTCFNGLFRLNKAKKFNVPWGKKKKLPAFPTKADYLKASDLLSVTTLYAKDYTHVLRAAHKGDVVYADPPYWGTFDGYSGEGFNAGDHRKLAKMLRRSVERGVSVFSSNINHPSVREIYSDWASIDIIPVDHTIAAGGGDRRTVDEVIIYATHPFVDPKQMDLFAGASAGQET
jgi:DNA adenine methylase